MIYELRDMLVNGVPIPILQQDTDIELKRFKSVYYELPFLSTSDVWTFKFNNIVPSAGTNYRIHIILYAILNRVLTQDSSVSIDNTTNVFSRDCAEGIRYFVEFRSEQDLTGKLNLTSQKYLLIKNIEADIYTGMYVSADLKTYPKIKEKECDIPIFFEFLEGELPLGLRMNGVGRIEGVICNLDDMIQTRDKSPSFNWFFTNYDGEQEPIGIVFRFKVRAYLQAQGIDDTSFTHEKWLCIRIFNNWSFDKAKFLDGIKQRIESNLICPETEVLDLDDFCCDDPEDNANTGIPEFKEIKFKEINGSQEYDEFDLKDIELKREAPKLRFCTACQDPTKPKEVETLILTYAYSTPEELLRYYKKNVGVINNTDIAKLANSKLFNELLEYIEADYTKNTYSLIELSLNRNIVTLIKFSDDKPLAEQPSIIDGTKNNLNQTLDIEVHIRYGEMAEGIYRG